MAKVTADLLRKRLEVQMEIAEESLLATFYPYDTMKEVFNLIKFHISYCDSQFSDLEGECDG